MLDQVERDTLLDKGLERLKADQKRTGLTGRE